MARNSVWTYPTSHPGLHYLENMHHFMPHTWYSMRTGGIARAPAVSAGVRLETQQCLAYRFCCDSSQSLHGNSGIVPLNGLWCLPAISFPVHNSYQFDSKQHFIVIHHCQDNSRTKLNLNDKNADKDVTSEMRRNRYRYVTIYVRERNFMDCVDHLVTKIWQNQGVTKARA
jgi:hypothetical protein